MKKIIFLPLFIISFVLASLFYFIWGQSYVKEKYIAHKITEANYCSSKSDCAIAAVSVCPFDCYVVVNQSRVDEIKRLLDGYESHCAYSCMEIKGVDCVANKCDVIR